MRQRQLLHKFFFEIPKINEYSCPTSDLTYYTSQMRYTIFYSQKFLGLNYELRIFSF